MSNAILAITDGTTRISFLEEGGFLLKGWQPTTAPWKAGGYWSQSALSTGRRLRTVKYDNIVDVFTLDIAQCGQDELIESVNALMELLEKAAAYWTEG